MTRKRNLNDVEICIDNIIEELSSVFEAAREELLNRLKKDPKYKRLKRVGEEQFFNATSESSIETESQNTRLCFATINVLLFDIFGTIDEIIREKFQGDFRNTLKDTVLKTILKLYSEPKSDIQEASENGKVLSSAGSSGIKQEEKDVENLHDLSNGETSEDNFSVGSVSSVHTSELSSFDDDIVFSSDEETGKDEKRMSIKDVQDRLTELKAKKLKTAKDGQNQVKTTLHEDASQSEIPGNESPSATQKSLSQRVRKPNSKYFAADVILSPLRRTASEKVSTASSASSSVENPLPRKRGRPRKHLT